MRSGRGRVVTDRPARPDELWTAVERLLEGASPLGALENGLGPLEARRLRERGLGVPHALGREERSAAVFAGIARPLLARIRASCEGPLVLLKGPEIAARYPQGRRAFSDIDLLTPDAAAVQRSLLAAGFDVHERGVESPHHLPPLVLESMPLKVELHDSLNWPRHGASPPPDELVADGVPSVLGIDGILAPSAAHHAVLMAAHSWVHQPLRILRDLVDVAAMMDETSRHEIRSVAGAWGVAKLWMTTESTVDALFYDARATVPLRTWARHLREVRASTVLETHLERCLSPFSALPVMTALSGTPRVLLEEISPEKGETWSSKLSRSAVAVRHRSMARRGHDELVNHPHAPSETGPAPASEQGEA